MVVSHEPSRPERFSRPQRAATLFLLIIFTLVVLASTIFSLGSYCLTTDGGNVRALEESIRSRQ